MHITLQECLGQIKTNILKVNVDPSISNLDNKIELSLKSEECYRLLNRTYKYSSICLQARILFGIFIAIFIGYIIYKRYNNITFLDILTNILERIKLRKANIHEDEEIVVVQPIRRGQRVRKTPLRLRK